MSGETRFRRAARVLLIDEHDRLLLVQARSPDTGRLFWHTPGGGVESGEDVRAAAEREVREETGLRQLGAVISLGCRPNRFLWRGVEFAQDEHWFLVWVSHFLPEPDGLNDGEEVDFTELRWWPPEALLVTEEELAPADLGAWTERLLRAAGRTSRLPTDTID